MRNYYLWINKMDEVIEKIATEILDVCGSSEEVSALIDNVLLYIADLVMDDDWEPEHKDLKLVMKDAKDDEMLEPEVEKEDIEVKVDADGFLSLR
jgi:hypothetical protein